MKPIVFVIMPFGKKEHPIKHFEFDFDRLYTDILCGYNAGVETVLVLSGEATKEEADNYEPGPTYIMPSVRKLHEEWKNSLV